MANDLKPKPTYQADLAEVERFWGAKSGTPEGDRLEILAMLVDARTHGPRGHTCCVLPSRASNAARSATSTSAMVAFDPRSRKLVTPRCASAIPQGTMP